MNNIIWWIYRKDLNTSLWIAKLLGLKGSAAKIESKINEIKTANSQGSTPQLMNGGFIIYLILAAIVVFKFRKPLKRLIHKII